MWIKVLIVLVAFAIFTLLVALSVVLHCYVAKHYDEQWRWYWIVLNLTTPGCVFALFLLAVLSGPYFFLYPERHMSYWDFHGTDEQRKALETYREDCAKRGIFRRAMEKFGLMKYSGPEWPDILTDDELDDETDNEN